MTSNPQGSEQSAHRTVIVLIRDVFFSVKVKNELTGAGYQPVLVKREQELLDTLSETSPALVLIDLNAKPDWESLSPLLKSEGEREMPPVLAFGPHKDVEARRTAQAAGVDRVVTNQQLHRALQDYVDRYARASGNQGIGDTEERDGER